MGAKDRGPRPRPDPWTDLVRDLRRAFVWRGDKTDDFYGADPAGWWAEPALLRRLGPALAGMVRDERPTAVLGIQSRGTLLGALVALDLGVGLVEVHKNTWPTTDSERWSSAHTPPDYRDRTLRLSARRDHLGAGHRVVLVDEWIETGGQALGARSVVEQTGATWCGAAVVVDGLTDPRLRRDLDVRSLLRVRDL